LSHYNVLESNPESHPSISMTTRSINRAPRAKNWKGNDSLLLIQAYAEVEQTKQRMLHTQ